MARFEPSKATDTQLLARFEEAGDSSAFAEIVRRHGPMVIATTSRNLNNNQDAEDAFQATFFALAKCVETIRSKQLLAAWLYKTARRTASTIRRSNQRNNRKLAKLRESMSEVPTEPTDAQASVDNAEVYQLLDDAIAKLPTDLQSVILLCHLEGMSHQEAATELGISSSSVSNRLAKARSLLKSKLSASGITLSLSTLLAQLTPCSSEAAATVSSSLVSETTRQALLYAAGKSISQIGARAAVIQAANCEAAFFTASKGVTLLLDIVLLFALTAGMLATSGDTLPVNGNTSRDALLFVDNFDDGNVYDGTPVNWTLPPDYSGIVDVSPGHLVLRTTQNSDPVFGVGIDTRKTANLTNVSLRTQAKVDRAGATFVLLARGSFKEGLPTAYAAGVTYNRQIGGSFVFLTATVDGVQTSLPSTRNPVLPYDIRREDTIVQFDVFGDSLRVWAWRAKGGSMPPEPQYEVSDTTVNGPGFLGLEVTNIIPQQATRPTQAEFRFLQVAKVPIHEMSPTLSQLTELE